MIGSAERWCIIATKKSPNAALIEGLKPARTIPYDPELMEALADHERRRWDTFNALRRDVYRRLVPTIWLEALDAETRGDVEQVKTIEMRADRQWHEAMGAPALTSFENLDIVMALVAAAGYPATDAGLHAWTIARLSIKPHVASHSALHDNRQDGKTNLQKPHWAADTSVLTYAGMTVRKYSEQAKNCRLVLSAFEECGWPGRLDDPDRRGANSDRVHNTVLSLNQQLSGIEFSAGDGGTSYIWKTLNMETYGEPTVNSA